MARQHLLVIFCDINSKSFAINYDNNYNSDIVILIIIKMLIMVIIIIILLKKIFQDVSKIIRQDFFFS